MNLGSMVSSIMGSTGSIAGSVASSLWSAREAGKNRSWQESMSSTAHQREVADLKAAGLNPILSAGGSGASTGSGATASINDLGSSFNSGYQTDVVEKRLKAEIPKIKADTSQSEFKVKLQKGALQYLKQNPQLKHQVYLQMLNSSTGVQGMAGLIDSLGQNLGSTAKRIYGKWKSAFKNSNKRIKKWIIDPKRKELSDTVYRN